MATTDTTRDNYGMVAHLEDGPGPESMAADTPRGSALLSRPMTAQEDIAAIKGRIARAESERDAWRAAGREEKYLEAYVTVEALLLQLDARSREQRPESSSANGSALT